MRALMLATVTTCLACAGVRNPGEPPAPDPARAPPADAATPPEMTQHAPWRFTVPLARMQTSPGPTVCPMPVHVPAAGAAARMPVSRGHPVPHMPVVPPGCANPLFGRDSAGR